MNNHSVLIKPMTTHDVAEVIELWHATEGLILTDTDNEHDLDFYFRRNPNMSHVARRGERIVGAVLCGHDGRRGYLHHLAVEASCRNQGIGRRLVAACLAKLVEAEIRQCNLFVIDDHTAGKQFWQKDEWFGWPTIRLMSKKLVRDSKSQS